MVTALEQYGTGGGIPIGAGIGGTAAMITGLQFEFAVVAGFGAADGLVIGGFAGRFTDANLNQENWQYRVVGFTLFVSIGNTPSRNDIDRRNRIGSTGSPRAL
jgi:hypothetical protein